MTTRNTSRVRGSRGIVAVLAMMFIVIFSALAAAMAIVSQGNLHTADSYQHVNRSLAAAETGMQFFQYRLSEVTATITTNKGNIDQTLSDQLWPTIRDNIASQIGSDLDCTLPAVTTSQSVTVGPIPTSGETGAPTFQVVVRRHPIDGEDYGSAFYQKAPYNVNDGTNEFTSDGMAVSATDPIGGWWLRIKSTGSDGSYSRSVQLDCRIDKKLKFAMLSRSRIMLGANVLVSGPIGSRYSIVNVNNGHPVQMKDNFVGLDSTLDQWIASFNSYLAAHDVDGDNRIRLADPREASSLANAASYDKNGDGYVDSYDLFLMHYDANSDGKLSTAEFTNSGGQMVDAQLWQLLQESKYPAGTQFDWTHYQVKLPGGDWTDATADLTTLDSRDARVKLSGNIVLTADQQAWQQGAAGGSYHNIIEGAISAGDSSAPIQFDATDQQLPALDPSGFDSSSYRAQATGDFNSEVQDNVNAGTGIYTPPSASTLESVPYESPYPYDYYQRPVYQNMTFTNVTIPKGTNALFMNCTFVGVTFVDTETANTDPLYNYAGAADPSGGEKYTSVVATVNGQTVSDTKSISNNVRFQDCTFQGPVTTAVPQAYTQARNKLTFTGTTTFDFSSATPAQQQEYERSSLFAPQYSVEMGSFTSPAAPNEVTRLNGTIVAGVADIRGQATIDGTLLSTYDPQPGTGPLAFGGNPANFNTTIGYFSSQEGDAEEETPTGGRGKIIIRYNKSRALPDGITGPIEVAPDMTTYVEGN